MGGDAAGQQTPSFEVLEIKISIEKTLVLFVYKE